MKGFHPLFFLIFSFPVLVKAQSSVQQDEMEGFRCSCSQIGLKDGWADSNRVSCYSIPVARDAGFPGKGKYYLSVAVAHSSNSNKDLPLLYLHGGPGIATLDNLPTYLNSKTWSSLRQKRDLIFFDYRGTGSSEPVLCKGLEDSLFAFSLRDTSAANRKQHEINLYITCRERLIREGVELSSFNSFQLAADAEEIRKALDIPEWNIYGVSYGTTIALNYLRNFSAAAQAVILDSPFPPNAPWADFVRPFDTAFSALQQKLLKDAATAKKFGELRKNFGRAVTRLNEKPALLLYRKAGGDVVEKYYTGDDFAWSVWKALLNPKFIPYVPLAILEVAHGNDSILQRWSEIFSSPNTFGKFSEPQSKAILCFEGRPQSYEDSEEFLAKTYPELTSFNSAFPTEVCNVWRPDSANKKMFQAVSSNKPVLILAGEYDPVCPPLFGALTAQSLPNSFFVVVPSASHAAIHADECVLNMAAAFLSNPDHHPPVECISGRKQIKFVTDNLPGALNDLTR